jgi:hypothetical protein
MTSDVVLITVPIVYPNTDNTDVTIGVNIEIIAFIILLM